MKIVESSTIPEQVEKLQNKTLVNVGIKEKVRVDGEIESVYYEYTQIELFADAQQKDIDKAIVKYEVEVAKDFLDRTDKKVLPYYVFEEGDKTLEQYIALRNEAREFVRANDAI